MKGPPLGLAGEDITWPDQVAPLGQRTPSSRNVEPQTSSLVPLCDLDLVLLKEVMAKNCGLNLLDLKKQSFEHTPATLTGCESYNEELQRAIVGEDDDDQLSEIASSIPLVDPTCLCVNVCSLLTAQTHSKALAACRCPWVLGWSCSVAQGVVVLFRLALVCVVLVSLLWCFASFCGVVWCCPPPPPRGAVRCFFFGCVLVVLRPPELVVVPCVVCCRAACRVVLRSVVFFLFAWYCVACLCWAGFLRRAVWRAVVLGPAVLFLLCSADACCCVLCFFFCVVHCLSVVARAVSVCVVLCRGASCCSAWPCRVAFLCWFLLRCAVWCSVPPWCVYRSVLCCLFRCGALVASCLVRCCGGLLCSIPPWAPCCVVLLCCLWC